MIAAPMINPALVFAVMMLAVVKRGKWFSEISNLHGVRYLIFYELSQIISPHFLTRM
jgi:hypothetical protein